MYQIRKVSGHVFVCYVMYLCVKGIDVDSFYDFLLDFRSVPTETHDQP